MRKRRKIVAVLLFPAIAVIFIVGWVLSTVGEPRASTKKSHKRNVPVFKHREADNEDQIEIGLMEELSEEHIPS